MEWYKYFDGINQTTTIWSPSSANTRYVPWNETRARTEELRNRLRDSMIYGNWIVKDETNNPLEPIGIEEII